MDPSRPKTNSRPRRNSAEKNSGSLPVSVVANHIDQGFMAWDHNHKIKIWNQAYVDLLNYPPEFLRIDQPLAEITLFHAENGTYGPGDPTKLAADRHNLLTGQEPVVSEQLEFGNGRVVQVRRHKPKNDKFDGIITYTDVTDLQMTREALVEANRELEHRVELRTRDLRLALTREETANRAKSNFLAHMSHELRTPLNSIIGFSDILGEELFGPLGNSRYDEYVQDIKASGQHLLAVITDILDIAKIEAGEARIEDDAIDLSDLIESVARMVRHRADEKGQDLAYHVRAKGIYLRGDGLRVKQILLNLLTNAVKFTPDGGKITLSGDLDSEGRVTFVVTDTGIGIEPSDIDRVLQPFGQVANSFVSTGEGTGLGLALSKMLMDMHGGSLTLESEPGIGTQVTLVFPEHRTATATTASN